MAENVAYGFETAQGVVNAWVKSDAHRKAMEGEATHFGISVKRRHQRKKLFHKYIYVKVIYFEWEYIFGGGSFC